ncbi:MAG: 6-carboxytetrahydropterin synthase [Spirochaetota bacterium]
MAGLFVRDLTVIDFSYLDSYRGVVGESWMAGIELQGELDDQSFVFDFGLVKKHLKRFLDDFIDHKLVVPEKYHDCTVLETTSQYEITFFNQQKEKYFYAAPKDSILLLPLREITLADVGNYLEKKISQIVPENVQKIQLSLHEEEIPTAYYHYSHGLKKHDGNCQRMVHGHRSKIEIYLDGKRAYEVEKKWVENWQDIYLVSEEDIHTIEKEKGYATLKSEYVCSQGKYYLEIPQKYTWTLPSDSTVECISQYIADEVAKSHSKQKVKVLAFEGVNKGAIAFAG